jgi:hypothetical protein
MRRLTGSTSRIITSTSWLVETILPGWTFFLVQDISDTWTGLRCLLQFHECTVVGDVGHAALELGADRVLGFDAFPRIGFKLLHAKADALGFRVDLG